MRRSCLFFNEEEEVLLLEILVRITAADITPANVEAAIKNDASSKGGSLFYILMLDTVKLFRLVFSLPRNEKSYTYKIKPCDKKKI